MSAGKAVGLKQEMSSGVGKDWKTVAQEVELAFKDSAVFLCSIFY